MPKLTKDQVLLAWTRRTLPKENYGQRALMIRCLKFMHDHGELQRLFDEFHMDDDFARS